jgi:hypothetical protein
LFPGSSLCHSLGSCLYSFSPFGANVNQSFARLTHPGRRN